MQPKKPPIGNKVPNRKNGNNRGTPKKNVGRTVVFWVVIGIIILALASTLKPGPQLEDLSFSELTTLISNGEVSKIIERGSELEITMKGEENATKRSRLPAIQLTDEQKQNITSKVEYVSEPPDQTNDIIWSVLGIVIPIGLIFFIFMFMMRGLQSQTNQSLSFGRSKAKLFGPDKKKAKFSDIAGNEESKEDLMEVVDFLKNPKKYLEVGAKIPKGVLLVGPPGTGKTMLARAVAGEANVPFFSISGSEFVEMFVGVGASRVRDLFEKAKKSAPCIIFIDEIDAVGRRRGSGMGGGHDEREQTLNQILVEMDGFENGQNVIVLAATNRADVLDPALLRPGRFDRKVNIALPERKDRKAILEVHFKDKPVSKSVDFDAMAAKTAGSAGADLANIANEAAIIAARNNRKEINNEDLTLAFEKIAIGPERKSKVMNDEEKKLSAYHESGHAVVGHILPNSDPVHKVTIIPRGRTGGVTWFIPPEDKNYKSLAEFKDELATLFGGRMAEEIVFGREQVTTGASNDLKVATDVARSMVMEVGMGKKLRDKAFHESEGGLMFDKMTQGRPYSEKTAEEIDREVSDILEEAASRAREILKINRKKLDELTSELLAKETLDGDEVKKVLKGTKLPVAAKIKQG